MIRSYLDANATTRPLPEVVDAVRRAMQDDFLNASSAAAAIWTGDPVGDAKRALAGLLDADPNDFFLTAGASESNSWVISAVAAGGHIITSSIEHASLRQAADGARRRGVLVTEVSPDADGLVHVADVMAAVTPRTNLVSVMLANNETGVVQPVAAIAQAVREGTHALFHTDATQAVGKIDISLSDQFENVDLLSLSAHKFHGPKGVGALFQRAGTRLPSIVYGEQEGGSRGGTYNSPGLAGMAVAAGAMRIRLPEWSSRVREMRDRMEVELRSRLTDAIVNGSNAPRLPNTTSLTVPGLDAAEMTDRLAMRGVCVATGSACSAGATAPSHVMTAMGISPGLALATLRFSLSLDSEWKEVALLLTELSECSPAGH